MSCNKSKILLLILGGSFALMLVSLAVHAEDDSLINRSAKIKAAVFFQVTKFLTLPNKTPDSKKIIFCYSGESIVASELEALIRGKQVNGKALLGHRLPDSGQCIDLSNTCDILFVDKIAHDKIERCITGTTVPSVCNVPKLSWQGCMGQVFEDDNHARIAIDLSVAKKLGVKISSDLLSMAIVNRSERTDKSRQP